MNPGQRERVPVSKRFLNVVLEALKLFGLALAALLLTIFGDAEKKLHGLVIDLRRNNGGDDPLGIEIASRLTGKKYLAYTKAARKTVALNLPLHFTDPQPTWVQPSDRPGFRGEVAVLIGPDTVSAGETFTMALMGREPHVTRIGLDTQGVFSDVLNRTLPNGWHFTLPNEIYFTADGKAFDGTGIPPDIRVPFLRLRISKLVETQHWT